MYYQNDKPLKIGQAFTYNDVQYPSNWLQLSTAEDKSAINITWQDDPVRADDRFYWNGNTDTPKALEDVDAVDENGDPVYVQVWNAETEQMENTSERLVTRGLKSTWIAQVKNTAGKMLAQTDWMVIRKAERDVAIPSATVTQRAAIVTECARLETAITAAADMDAFIAAVNNQRWPG